MDPLKKVLKISVLLQNSFCPFLFPCKTAYIQDWPMMCSEASHMTVHRTDVRVQEVPFKMSKPILPLIKEGIIVHSVVSPYINLLLFWYWHVIWITNIYIQHINLFIHVLLGKFIEILLQNSFCPIFENVIKTITNNWGMTDFIGLYTIKENSIILN